MTKQNLNPFFRSRQRKSFTLIELLVVVSIVGILATLIISGGVWAVNKAKVNETQGLLKTLDMAAEQFASDNPYGRIQEYVERYGVFPPDELACYKEDQGIPTAGSSDKKYLSPRPGVYVIDPYDEMADTNPEKAYARGRSRIQAFMLACQFASPAAAEMLDHIDPRFVKAPPRDDNDLPIQYFDRDGSNSFTEGDEQLMYLVDSWKMPIRYLNVRSFSDTTTGSPQNTREQFAIWAIRKNGNKPVFFSFGPNGEEQMKSTDMWVNQSTPPSPCHDYAGHYGTPGIVDDVLNADNVYSTEGLAEKLRTP